MEHWSQFLLRKFSTLFEHNRVQGSKHYAYVRVLCIINYLLDVDLVVSGSSSYVYF
jgi:hypothetical protein